MRSIGFGGCVFKFLFECVSRFSIITCLSGCIFCCFCFLSSSRGTRTRRLKVASVCSGMSLDTKVYLQLAVPHDYVFTCANKKVAFEFISKNFDIGHHFVALREIAIEIEGEGRCAFHKIHGVARCSCVGMLTPGMLDILTAGDSCNFYSRASIGRFDGTTSHRDADLSVH